MIRRPRLPLFAGLVSAIALVGALGYGLGFRSDPAGAEAPIEPRAISRTFVYHQITSLDRDYAFDTPVLSADGTKVVFADGPGTGAEATPNRIYVANSDGTGQVEVDAYQTLCFCGSFLDISADGGKVVSTDSTQIRIVNGDGSGKRTLLTLTSNEINSLKISGDGTKVFFKLRRDAATPGSSTSNVPVGLWVVNADGTGLRRVAGSAEVAAAAGTTADKVGSFGTNGRSLDVTADGSRIVFGTYLTGLGSPFGDGVGNGVFGISLDGTGARHYTTTQYVNQVAISADGGKVGYHVIRAPCCSSPNEVAVINYDGTGRRVLAANIGEVGSGSTFQLSADGTKLLLGDVGYLWDTATGAVTQLAVITSGAGGHTAVLTSALYRATMNRTATKFLYVMSYIRCADCVNQPKQLATLEINPASLGEAPSITDPQITPNFVVLNGGSTATASARVTTSNAVQAVALTFLRDGLFDINLRGNGFNGPPLYDDGKTQGDAVAGDGLYTSNQVSHSSVVVRANDTGPRTPRAQAEVKTASNRLHATAVEFDTFEVVSQAPATATATATATVTPTPLPGGRRVFVYHQITGFTADPALGAVGPVLAGNGAKAAFADGPGTGDAARPNKIYVINADGTGQTEVDSYTTGCFCGSTVDISDDGARVISTDSVQLRIANADGSGRRSLITSGEIKDIRIAGDGRTVFFQLRRDGATPGSSTSNVPRGVWAINPDGTGLRQVVGPTQVASLLGVSADAVFTFDVNGYALDASTDGARLIFGTNVGGQGQYLLGVNADGSGLHAIVGPVAFVYSAGISGDGTKAGYAINFLPCCSSPNEVGVASFDGTGKRTLITQIEGRNIGIDPSSVVQLSADGAKLLLPGSESGYLWETATGAVTQLAVQTSGSGGHTTVLYSGLAAATMNTTATRFLYLMSFIRCADCVNQPKQLATLDINPASLGDAPTLTNPAISPNFVALNGGSTATATVQVATTHAVQAVAMTFLRDGLFDINLRGNGFNGPPLYDDGKTQGDVVAGDGLYTSNQVSHSSVVVRANDTGPRTPRAQAEVKTAAGRLHATSLELEPFEVVATAPTVTPTPAVSATPRRTATAGATGTATAGVTGTATATSTGGTATATSTSGDATARVYLPLVIRKGVGW